MNEYSQMSPEELAIIVVVLIAFLLPFFIAFIFYLVSLHKALSRCQPENRAMEPGMVWLMLIPLFSIVWQFLVVLNLSKSIKNEFHARGQEPAEAEPGKGVGLAMCILGVASNVPYIGALPGLASVVCWIIHWVKIAGYSKQLAAFEESTILEIP